MSPFAWQINKAFLLRPKLSPGFKSVPRVQKGQAFGDFLMGSVMVHVPLWEDTGNDGEWLFLSAYPVGRHLSSSSFRRFCQSHSQTLFLSGIVTGIYTYIHIHTYIIYIYLYLCIYCCHCLEMFHFNAFIFAKLFYGFYGLNMKKALPTKTLSCFYMKFLLYHSIDIAYLIYLEFIMI